MLRIAPVLLLAASAPAPLSAAFTLTTAPSVRELAPGASVELVAEKDGVPVTAPVKWFVIEKGRLVIPDHLTHSGPGDSH